MTVKAPIHQSHPQRRCRQLSKKNVVAQMLKASGNELFYHVWPTPSGKHNYEIDFLLSHSSKLCPIEVKSSGYKAHVSLDEFCKKFSSEVLWRYLVYTKDLRKEAETLHKDDAHGTEKVYDFRQ